MKNIDYLNKTPDELWLLSVDDKFAFRHLFEGEFDKLYAYGMKIHKNKPDVKDAIQNLFMDMWIKRKERNGIRQIRFYLLKSLRYSLLKISSTNKIIDLEQYQIVNHNVESTEQQKEIDTKLLQILNEMPNRQREVLHLKFFQGLSNQEIAELLNVNYQSISNTLQRSYSLFKKKSLNKKFFK